jgi:hypothetical protein
MGDEFEDEFNKEVEEKIKAVIAGKEDKDMTDEIK